MAAITTTGTLTAGNSRTFALAPGSALTLTLLPNCRVTVTETPETVSASDAGGNSPRTHNHQFAGVFTYGPYVMGGSVVVDNASNSGSTVTWGRKDTTVSTSSDGLSLVSGDGNAILLGAAGPKTVLFGDSMTDFYNTIITPSSASYEPTTGVITVSETAHRLCNGSYTRFWHYSYASVRDQRRLAVTIVDANTYTVTLTDKPTDIPSGAIAGTIFFRHESRRSAQSWVNWLQARNNFCINVVNNAAQSGDTSTGCLSRLSRDVLAYSPELVLMQAPGINDESASNGALAETTTITALQSIFAQILATNAQLIVLTITPVASGEARGTKAIMERVQRKNRWIWDYARGKQNIHVVDSWAYIVDPTNTTGLAVAAKLKTTDTIHYTNDSALAIAKLVEPVLQKILPARAGSLPRSAIESLVTGALASVTGAASAGVVTMTSTAHGYRVGETVRVKGATPAQANGVFTIASVPTANTFTYAASGIADGALTGTLVVGRSPNVFRAPLLLTATGGTVTAPVTGTAASGLSISNIAGASGTFTAAASVASEANGFGNEQLVAVTAATTGDGVKIRANNSTGSSSYVDDIIVGRTYCMECQLRLASTAWATTPIDEIDFALLITMNSIERRVSAIEIYDGITNPSVSEDMTLHLRTQNMTIPAGATINSATWELRVRHKGLLSGGATLTVGMSRIAIWDVTEYSNS